VADGAFSAIAGRSEEGFVMAVGLADEGDRAGDVGVGGGGKQEQENKSEAAIAE
jgi:hypothetical protein